MTSDIKYSLVSLVNTDNSISPCTGHMLPSSQPTLSWLVLDNLQRERSGVGIILSSFILILFWDVVVGLEIRLLWEVNELNILMRLKLSREFILVLINQNIKSYNKTKGNYFLRDTIIKYIKSAVISKTENLCTSTYLQYVMRKIWNTSKW